MTTNKIIITSLLALALFIPLATHAQGQRVRPLILSVQPIQTTPIAYRPTPTVHTPVIDEVPSDITNIPSTHRPQSHSPFNREPQNINEQPIAYRPEQPQQAQEQVSNKGGRVRQDIIIFFKLQDIFGMK